jgi:hypothetical protein
VKGFKCHSGLEGVGAGFGSKTRQVAGGAPGAGASLGWVAGVKGLLTHADVLNEGRGGRLLLSGPRARELVDETEWSQGGG